MAIIAFLNAAKRPLFSLKTRLLVSARHQSLLFKRKIGAARCQRVQLSCRVLSSKKREEYKDAILKCTMKTRTRLRILITDRTAYYRENIAPPRPRHTSPRRASDSIPIAVSYVWIPTRPWIRNCGFRALQIQTWGYYASGAKLAETSAGHPAVFSF